MNENNVIHLHKFGRTIAYSDEKKKKKIRIELSENFLPETGLESRPDKLNVRRVVRPSYRRMAKIIKITKSMYTKIMNNIFEEIKNLINETENVTIDLGKFGKFQANKKTIVHAPQDENEARDLQGK